MVVHKSCEKSVMNSTLINVSCCVYTKGLEEDGSLKRFITSKKPKTFMKAKNSYFSSTINICCISRAKYASFRPLLIHRSVDHF